MSNISQKGYNSKFKQLFLMVPISALEQLTFKNQVVLFCHCIVEASKKFTIDYRNALHELSYAWYHNPGILTESLLTALTEIQEQYADDGILSDEDNEGFGAYGEFNPEYDMDYLVDIIKDRGLVDEVKQFAAIKKAEDLFNMKPINPDILIADHAKIEAGRVFAKVHPSVMWMLLSNKISLDAFKMYVAIRSIEGNKSFTLTTKKFISTRMHGYEGKADIEPISRRLIDKYMNELIDLGLVQMLPGGRSWYISTRLNREQLMMKISQKKTNSQFTQNQLIEK